MNDAHCFQLHDIPMFCENMRILLESSEGLAYLHGGDDAGRIAVTHCDVKRFVYALSFVTVEYVRITCISVPIFFLTKIRLLKLETLAWQRRCQQLLMGIAISK